MSKRQSWKSASNSYFFHVEFMQRINRLQLHDRKHMSERGERKDEFGMALLFL